MQLRLRLRRSHLSLLVRGESAPPPLLVRLLRSRLLSRLLPVLPSRDPRPPRCCSLRPPTRANSSRKETESEELPPPLPAPVLPLLRAPLLLPPLLLPPLLPPLTPRSRSLPAAEALPALDQPPPLPPRVSPPALLPLRDEN